MNRPCPPSRPALAAALAALALALPGCISYTVDLLPPAGELPAPIDPAHRPTVSYSIRPATGSDYQVSADGGGPWGVRDGESEAATLLTTSGQFRSVEPYAEDRQADLHLEMVLVVDANDVILFAGACTFFIIPTWRTVTFNLSVEARSADGRWKRYALSDSARDINWLPLILGMSFAPWGTAYAEVRTNLYHTLLQRLHEDGFLRPVGG